MRRRHPQKIWHAKYLELSAIHNPAVWMSSDWNTSAMTYSQWESKIQCSGKLGEVLFFFFFYKAINGNLFFHNFWSKIWFISIWSASVSWNLSLSYLYISIKICSTVSGRSHFTQSPDSCFPILYNEWLSALSPILRWDIMLSSFLFPKIILSFPTVFWILYKCRPLFSPSHLLCRISFNAFFNL